MSRPSSYDRDHFPWVLAKLSDNHPARKCGVFVVHGMGDMKFAETAATLREGFEDVMEDMKKKPTFDGKLLPPPYIFEAFWGNYDDLKETFREEWGDMGEGERKFFSVLWQKRTHGVWSTLGWFYGQMRSLVGCKAAKKLGWKSQLIYEPLQIVFPVALLVLFWKMRRAITHVLADVRVYCAPKVMIEKVIVQGIDCRVAAGFLRMLGLRPDFRSLYDYDALHANNEVIRFTRVVWVAHSLGTVVSYNALSDLFHKAAELEKTGDAEQQQGVALFRSSLASFITLGSPLDKFAHLCGEEALKPWLAPRAQLLDDDNKDKVGRWLNYFNVLDPVSGALDHPLLFMEKADQSENKKLKPPQNFHVRLWSLRGLMSLVPGLAHVAYWHDKDVLRVILEKTYGPEIFPSPPGSLGRKIATWHVVLGYFTWLGIMILLLAVIVAGLAWLLWPWLVQLNQWLSWDLLPRLVKWSL